MDTNFSPIIKQLVLLYAVSLVVSFSKNEVILHYCFSSDVILPTRLSSMMSTSVANLISIILLFLILISTWYASILLSFGVSFDAFTESAKNFVRVFLLGELVKFSFIWILLPDEIQDLDYENLDFKEEILNTNYLQYIDYTNVSIAILALGTFSYFLYQTNTKLTSGVFISLTLSLLLLFNILV